MAGPVLPATAVGWKRVVPPWAFVWLVLALALLAGLFWADRGSLGQIAVQFETADWWLAALALILIVSVDLAKAWRWQTLFGALQPSYRRVLQAQVVGQAANALVPLRLGEVLRVSWAAPTPSGVARGTAGLVLTRAIDAIVLAGLIAFVCGGSLLAQAQLLAVVSLGLLVAVMLGLAQRYRHNGSRMSAVKLLLTGSARYARELHAGIIGVVVVMSGVA